MPENRLVNGGVCLSVVSHGQGALPKALLADLFVVRPPSLERLIVTCNISEPVELPSLAPFWIEVVENREPKGFGANHNAALKRCAEPFFAVCNPDIRLREDPFPVLLAALSAGRALSAPAVVSPRASSRLMVPASPKSRTASAACTVM